MTPDELKKMTKAELLEFARLNSLRVTSQMLKSELIETISTALKRKKDLINEKFFAKPGTKGSQVTKLAGKNGGPVKGAPAKPAASARPPQESARDAAKPAARRGRPPKAKPKPPARITERVIAKTVEKVRTEADEATGRKEPATGARRGRPKGATKEAAAASSGKAAPEAERPREVSDELIRQRVEEGKYYLGAEERAMPPVEAVEIPWGYNVTRIAALVRDPHWIFSYWEITESRYRELERAFGSDWPRTRMILRVYDRTAEPATNFDLTITPEARNWYVNVAAERRYQIAIGALGPDGRFEQIAISNIVETPSGRISDRMDEEWMVPDDVFRSIFAASGGHDMHAASAELRELLEKRLQEEIASGAVSSFGSGSWPKEERERKFRLWVATELILYGATEPNARVSVQGKEIKLRNDGTFSLRYALPDGLIDLPVTAASADGVEERTIETSVKKKSNEKAPVLK